MSLRGAKMRIGFVGTFEVENYGDCLFPVVYRKLLERDQLACEFSYYSPRGADVSPLGGYGPVQPLPATSADCHFSVDKLIQCGGETLWLGHSSGTYNFPASTLSAFARMWLGPTLAAGRGELDFLVHSVGMPTLNLDPQPEIARGLGHASRVSLRDAVSAARLGNLFPVEVDPMFAVSTCEEDGNWEALAQTHLPDGFAPGAYLCAHVSAPYLPDGIRPWCEQVFAVSRQTGHAILLTPICHFLDDHKTLEAARAILIEMGIPPADVQFPKAGSEQVMATAALLGKSSGVITSSLHALVTAVSFGIPMVGYVGEGKSDGKHRQTLLAAGADYGVALTIQAIAATFEEARKQDLCAARVRAIGRALEDFGNFRAALVDENRKSRPMPDALLAELVDIDRRDTRNFRREAKRVALRLLKRARFSGRLLEARRRARLVRAVGHRSVGQV